MKKQFGLAAAALSALVLAPSAHATVVEGIQLPAGTLFDHFEGKSTSTGSGQVDLFTFTITAASLITTSILTSVANAFDDLEFESVELDGNAFTISNGFFSSAKLSPVAIEAGSHTLRVQYSATRPNVTYSGNIAIAPADVPAPASWTLAIVGIAGLGLTLASARANGSPGCRLIAPTHGRAIRTAPEERVQ